MFCKHCGKPIANGSAFCHSCGGKIDTPDQESKEDSTIEQIEQPEEKEQQLSKEVVLTVKRLSHYKWKSIIADEIVGNLKMVGLALAFFAFYMIGFILVHQKDIKEYDYPNSSYFGESCYDPHNLIGNWKFNWEEHYNDQLFYNLYGIAPFCIGPSPKECLENAKSLEKRLNYTEDEIEYWKAQAKNSAKRDKQDWTDTINAYRKSGYEDDIKQNATYASIICLILCVVGRYLVKLTKWVIKNKTE